MSDVFGGLLGEEATPQQNGYGAWPKFAKDAYEGGFDLYNGMGADPYKWVPYTDQGFQAINQLKQGNTLGQIGGNFNFGQQANTAFGQGSALMNEAPDLFRQAGIAPTSAEISSAIGDYYNPFERDVIGGMEQDYNRGLDIGLGKLASRAGNAFGGSGVALSQGTLASEALNDFNQNTANTRYAGYNTAAGLGSQQLQNNRNNMLNAGTGILSAGTSLGTLGNNLIGARQTMQNIAGQQIDQYQNQQNFNLNNLLQADQMRRAPAQQNQGAQLQQLQTLISLLAPLSGTATGGIGATQGIIGSGGNMNMGGNGFNFVAGQPVR